MFISQKLKQENISEYLLYMWQVEDIIRAFGADTEQINAKYLSKFTQQTPQQQSQMQQWYSDLCVMMREEGVMQRGHLQINKNIVILLNDLHQQLLASPKFPFYSAAYYKALPYIVELRSKGESKECSEIENCFDALYGVMLLKLQGKAVSKETAAATADIVKLLGMLSDYYKEDKAGKLKLD